MNAGCYLKGLGAYSPERILTNAELETFVDTTDEWIRSRTGIAARHILADGERTSDEALNAARAALADAHCAPETVTHVLVGSCTPDYLCPSLACIVAGRLGIADIMAFDFNAACSGYLYGLELVRMILGSQPEAKVLLIAAEGLSRRVNWADRSTCVLFGDGASATLFESLPEKQIARLVDVKCSSDGTLADLLTIGGGTASPVTPGALIGDDYFISMQGREVFKHAVRRMVHISEELLARNSLSIDDVQLFIPHQANMRIIEAVGERLHIPAERVFVNVQNYGNTSAASIPLALCDARQQGRIRQGDLVLLTAFGGGFTWSSALMQF